MEPLVVGIPEEELRPRFDESLDIIDRAIAELKVTHHGRFWNFDALCVTPRTLQPHPPKWMTVVSEQSARIAARRGYKVCTAFMSAQDAATMFDAYREEATRAGGSTDPDQMALRRRCLVWDTDSSAESLGKEVLRIGLERTGRLLKHMTDRGITPLTGVEHIDKQILAMRHTDAIDAPASKFAAEPDEWVVGSPETVAAKIIDQCRTCGAGHFLAYSLGSMEEAEMEHSMDLWRRVIPILQNADVAARS